MFLNRMLLSAGVVALALGTSGLSADAAQQGDREGRARPRDRSSDSRDSDRRGDRQGNGRSRSDQDRQGNQRAQRGDERQSRDVAPARRGDTSRGSRDVAPERRGDTRGRVFERPRSYNDRYDGRRGVRRPAPRRYYGPGGHLSVYFGVGSGYRYGAPYSGRVYGYAGRPGAYGARRYYGDVRLLVRPRDAAVYVDGYYAGVVDDFDGVFQRLTLEVGPHQIEIEAGDLGSQIFDVYVDPARTVDLHGDLLRDGRY